MSSRSGFAALSLTALVVAAAPAAGQVIYEPHAEVAGRTVGAWTAAWWRWATAIPYQTHPLVDETGEFANRNQRGPVYFIGGAFGGTHERSFEVPAGKPILIPLVNYQADNVLYDPPHTVEELFAEASGNIDGFDSLHLRIDGAETDDLFAYRETSPPYAFAFPEDNLYDYFGVPISAGVYEPGVSDGYWVMLYPLEEGSEHTIEFGGSNSTTGFELNMTVKLRVVAPPQPNIELTAIGAPKWEIADAHLISFPIGLPPNFDGFLDTSQRLLPEPNHRFHPQLFIGPGDPHDGPYDQEFADGIVVNGLSERSTFAAYEWSFPNGVGLVGMAVPTVDAPSGRTPDSESGLMIPNSVCPITFSGVTLIGDEVFDPNWGFQVPGLDQVDPPFDVDGHSHIPLFFVDAAEFGTGGPEGDYTYDFQLVDAEGNGWKIKASFEVESGPVVPLFGSVAAKSLADWSVRWWQWAMSYPADENPLLDETGETSHVGDQGAVFFLAGTLGGEASRTVTVRDSQYILLPTVNYFFFLGPGEDLTEEEVRLVVDRAVASMDSLFVRINGSDVVTNPYDFRLPSPAGFFQITLPEGNVYEGYGIPAGSYDTVSDGYYVMLRPLPVGNYTLEFGGTTDGSDGSDPFSTKVTVELNVLPTPARGDLNCDGSVDFADIDGFVAALIGLDNYHEAAPGCYYLSGDVNADGAVDFNDIDGFVECIIGGGCP